MRSEVSNVLNEAYALKSDEIPNLGPAKFDSNQAIVVPVERRKTIAM